MGIGQVARPLLPLGNPLRSRKLTPNLRWRLGSNPWQLAKLPEELEGERRLRVERRCNGFC